MSNDEIYKQLMIDSQNGSQTAYRKLFELVSIQLEKYIKKKITNQNDQEDILQICLIAIHNASHTYQKSKLFLPWMYSIANYKINDYWRKFYKSKEINNLNDLENTNIGQTNTLGIESKITTNSILNSLSEKDAELIRLKKIEGYSNKELAKYYNMSESATKVRLHRIIKALKNTFGRQS